MDRVAIKSVCQEVRGVFNEETKTLVFDYKDKDDESVKKIIVCYDTMDGAKDFFMRIKRCTVWANNQQILSVPGWVWSTWTDVTGQTKFHDTGASRLYIPLWRNLQRAGVDDCGIPSSQIRIEFEFSKTVGDESSRMLVHLGVDVFKQRHLSFDRAGNDISGLVQFETIQHVVQQELKHKQNDVMLVVDQTGVGADAPVVRLVYGILGRNEAIKKVSIKGAHNMRVEFERPYDASVLDKMLNDDVIPRSSHILTCRVESWCLAEGVSCLPITVTFDLDGEEVPDGCVAFVFPIVEQRWLPSRVWKRAI